MKVRFRDCTVDLRPSGALYLAAARTLVVSDLHLGKAERIARRAGTLLPPYDTRETLDRLADEIAQTAPEQVICLGDSFDDLQAAHSLSDEATARISTLQAGRDWIWIEGNHDAGPVALGGQHRAQCRVANLVFRHIATPGEGGEISGHYHPKARIKLRGRSLSRACFVFDTQRMILPAFGAYTGGLWTHDPALSALFDAEAQIVLTGRTPVRLPMPR